ncbi:MAG: hypothetical protein HYY02_02810 [Chloroflexi bacterium]|nr:hypothetical protein [Chloroflexota bacterium]
MSDKRPYDRERHKVAQLALEYRRKGYEVLSDALLPDGKLRADLLVRKGDQVIVIEVTSSKSLHSQRNAVSQLAAYVATLPGARFDLVLTNPRKRR